MNKPRSNATFPPPAMCPHCIHLHATGGLLERHPPLAWQAADLAPGYPARILCFTCNPPATYSLVRRRFLWSGDAWREIFASDDGQAGGDQNGRTGAQRQKQQSSVPRSVDIHPCPSCGSINTKRWPATLGRIFVAASGDETFHRPLEARIECFTCSAGCVSKTTICSPRPESRQRESAKPPAKICGRPYWELPLSELTR